MSDFVTSPLIHPRPNDSLVRRFVRAAEYLEAWAVTLWCSTLLLLGFALAILAVIEVIPRASVSFSTGLAILLLLPAVILELYGQILIYGTILSDPLPFGVSVARKHRLFPLPLRLLVSLWWFAHFLFSAMLAVSLTVVNHSSTFAPWLVAIFTFVFTCGANVFLLLSIAAFNSQSRSLVTVWRYRFLLDILVAAVAFTIAHRQ